jgi:hypothetical protein
LHILNITGAIKVRKVSWDGQAESIEEIRNMYKILVTKPEAKSTLKYVAIEWKILLK